MKQSILLALAAFLLTLGGIALALPTNTTAQQVEINAQVNWGLSEFANSLLLNYQEPNTTTALFNSSITVVVPAATNNYQVNLATTFPFLNDAIVYGIKDMSNPGQQVDIGLASSGQRFSMAPGGFFVIRVDGSAPTLYIDNPSVSDAAILQVFTMGN